MSTHGPLRNAANLNDLRILVVEDGWAVASAAKHLLEMQGADVLGPVASTADAVWWISQRTIDVAVVDICLRGGELAYDLIDRLHAQGIRIVVVTGYPEVLPSVQGKVAVVLQKPVRRNRLLQSLRPAEVD